MANKYGLPEDRLEQIRLRDKKCVYCDKEMTRPRKGTFAGDWATIEHLNHKSPWNNPDTVAICCGSCNSSRRDKTLLKWFESPYCEAKQVNTLRLADPVRSYINQYEK